MATDTVQHESVTATRLLWDDTFAEYERAKRAIGMFQRDTYQPAHQKAQEVIAKVTRASGVLSHSVTVQIQHEIVPDWDTINDMSDILDERLFELGWKLIKIPAPDGAALLWKMDFLWPENRDEGEGVDSFKQGTMQIIMDDTRRLLS